MLDQTAVRKGRKSKRQKQLEEFNNKYPIGWLNRSQLLEKVDDAYISMRNDELVSIGPRLTPSALEAIEWFETEYAYLPIYLILDAWIHEFYTNINAIKAYEFTADNIVKATEYGVEKKQKVIKISKTCDSYLTELSRQFPKFNKSDVVNLVLITYKNYLNR